MKRATSKVLRDALVFGFVGLTAGGVAGIVIASAWAVVTQGGKFTDVEGFEILDHAPWVVGNMQEPFETGVLIIGAAGLIGMTGFIAISYRPQLTSHGSARWATKTELKKAGLAVKLNDLSGPIYAKLSAPKRRGEFVTSSDIPHSFICAPTGSGKGVGIVIPTLLTYGGSVICLDVKGENFDKTARARAAIGDRIFRFSPLDEDNRSHRFNPLDRIANLSPERRFTEAKRIAESFIAMPGDNVQGFLVSAKEILAASVLVVIERGTPTIAAIYDLLSQGGEYNAMFEKLASQTDVPESKSIYYRMAGIADRTLSAYMSVLFDGGLGLWRDGLVRAATETSDFDIANLRRKPSSIYIVVAPNDLAVLAPVVRLLFQQTVAILQTTEPKRDEPYPVLFLLDEFPQLGRMTALGQAISTIRSYGGRMMIVAQSLSNLRGTYGNDGAQNFLANCRLQLFMAPADSETPDYVSKAIGNFTRKARSKSWMMGQIGKSNIQEREEGARLLRPEELRNLSADECVLLIQDSNPVKAHKVRYFEDRYLKTVFVAQAGEMPLPQALMAKPSVTSTLNSTGQPMAASDEAVEESDISPEDFRIMKSHQTALLDRVRRVKQKVSSA
ncbi:MAG: type IV secretion system ATPase VirD4 [Ahrensia sp.]|nr:type IV secretion system ATPase VirD4 [Ahrensia sp.]